MSSTVFLLIFMGCDDSDTFVSTSATLFFVNQSSHTIKWAGNPSDFFTDIPAGDTLIYKEKYEEYFGCPTVDNYGPLGRDQVVPIYGDTGKCELGLLRIENYENRQEVEDLVFEFTFRFTEERFQNAQECQ